MDAESIYMPMTAVDRLSWVETVGLDGGLPARAKSVAMALVSRIHAKTGKLCPALSVIRRDTGLSESTVLAALADLCGAGYVRRCRRVAHRLNGPERLSNAYRLTRPPVGDEEKKERSPDSGVTNIRPPEPSEENHAATRAARASRKSGAAQTRQPNNQDENRSPERPDPTPRSKRKRQFVRKRPSVWESAVDKIPTVNNWKQRHFELLAGTVSTAMKCRDQIAKAFPHIQIEDFQRLFGQRADAGAQIAAAKIWAAAEAEIRAREKTRKPPG